MEDTKLVQSTEKRKPPAAGMGRKVGAVNKTPKAIKDMILQALEGAGGVSYLQDRAKDPKTAAAFLGLVGKVLPMQVTGEGGGPIRVATVEWTVIEAQS